MFSYIHSNSFLFFVQLDICTKGINVAVVQLDIDKYTVGRSADANSLVGLELLYGKWFSEIHALGSERCYRLRIHIRSV